LFHFVMIFFYLASIMVLIHSSVGSLLFYIFSFHWFILMAIS